MSLFLRIWLDSKCYATMIILVFIIFSTPVAFLTSSENKMRVIGEESLLKDDKNKLLSLKWHTLMILNIYWSQCYLCSKHSLHRLEQLVCVVSERACILFKHTEQGPRLQTQDTYNSPHSHRVKHAKWT